MEWINKGVQALGHPMGRCPGLAINQSMRPPYRALNGWPRKHFKRMARLPGIRLLVFFGVMESELVTLGEIRGADTPRNRG